MKKTILISIGTLILLLILGIWVYLFMYGTPKSADDVFARFGIGGDSSTPSTRDATQTNTNEIESGAEVIKKLRQLTLRPVAGATFTGTGILYVEQGTGHIYHINFGSGAETLVSGTTIPEARNAHFSLGGAHVAITTTYGTLPETIVGSVTLENGTGSLDGVSLPLNARNIRFGEATNTLMYTLEDTEGTSGYSYNVTTGSGVQIFRVSLGDVRVLWGDTLTYIYTTPSATQRGGIYRIENNNLEYVTQSGFGLMGFIYDDGVVITQNTDSGVASYALTKSGSSVDVSLPLIPEKCVSIVSTTYCAVPFGIPENVSFPDIWYKGGYSFSDALWKVEASNGVASFVVDFLTESGREIDVRTIGTNEDGTYIYFINKNDNTLWMFDTTQ